DPSALSASAIGSSQINLSWTDNSGNEDGFMIERKQGSGAFSQIATVGAGVSSFSNTGLSPSTSYTYQVRAYNAVGNSAYSNQSTASTGAASTSATYEAEAFTSQSGTTVVTGPITYVDYGGNGTYMEWNNVNVPSAGSYNLTFTYANGSGGNRQCALLINGSSAGNLSFPPSGSWSVWTTTTFTGVSLNAGNNTLRIAANTSSGGPNLDKMLVGSGSGSVSVTSVSLAPSTLALNVGASSQLTASISPANATNQSVSFSSSANGVATVSSSGLVTAVGVGSATITVTTADGGKTASSSVIVSAPSASNLVFNPGFEFDFANWNVAYGARSIVTNDQNSGSKSCYLSNGGGVEQTISGLSANTTYTFKAFAKKISGGSTLVGVKNSQIGQLNSIVNGASWTQYSLTFNTGASTSVNVFLYGGGGVVAYFDDFELTLGNNLRLTGFTSEKQDSEISIFPNPIQQGERLTLQGLDADTRVAITDALGKLVLNPSLSAESISTDMLSAGVYFVVLSNSHGIIRREKLLVY
ncbi:MAG: carbohydrate-binding protein, partial [Cytophagales bacterium]|nr:carbohydrate-binding protein [Cytophagales bacterium]